MTAVHAGNMLVFIDESGDPGFRFSHGSSRFFTIAMVVFDDHEEAVACDRRIELLHRELQWQDEFHFKRNPDHVRDGFVKAVARYNFFYYGVVIDKERQHRPTEQFPTSASFHRYVCGLVFECAKEKLSQATIIIDESGSTEFGRTLAQYLRRRMNTGGIIRIGKVKTQRSHGNNLLQLADYIAGILNRSVHGKKHGNAYRSLLSHREMMVRVWPSTP